MRRINPHERTLMADYTLPDLPYDYGALQPHISGEIMELHHSKHHATYVKALNAVIDQLAEARDNDSLASVGGMEKTLAFNLGGHINHSVFWPNLSPNGGDKPDGELAAAIDEFFGSFDAFKKQLSQSTSTVQGSGWGALTWEPLGERLFIEQIYDHQGNTGQGGVP